MRPRGFLLLIVSGTLLASCNWQMPQTVTVKGSPEVYIPSGATVFELDFLEDIADDFSEAMAAGDPASGDGAFTGGEKPTGQDGYGSGDTFTVYAELSVNAPTFPDVPLLSGVDVGFSDSTQTIDISEVFGPIPDTVVVQSLPAGASVQVWYEPVSPLTATSDPVRVRLRAEWDGGGSQQWLLGDGTSSETLSASRTAATKFDVAGPLNARPTDLQLYYDFGTSSDVATGNEISSLHVRFEIPFALETVDRSFLDLTDDQGKNELAMDDDIFGRDPEDPDEDVQDLVESLRSSSAELVMRLENVTGMAANLAMVNGAAGLTEVQKQNPANWALDVGLSSDPALQQVELDISAATLDEFIDGVPLSGVSQFKPEFLIELPWNGLAGTPQAANQFSIKKGAAFNVTEGYLRVQADFEYSFSLEDED
jgi:hypothetical protein